MERRPDVRALLVAALDGRDGSPWWVGLAARESLYALPTLQMVWWQRQPARERARWLLDQLSDCQDRLPPDICEQWGWPSGTTIAQAVHCLRPSLE